MKLVIIANPIAGRGRAYRSIQNYVRRTPPPDWLVELIATRHPDHAGLLARGLLKDPPDLLAICGGDGTVNEVASSLPEPPFPIALLPAGTANVIARELGLPLNPVRALQIALKRVVRRVDLGELGSGSRRFLFVAGAGFDAYVAAKVRPEVKKKLGMAAYAAEIVRSLRSYSFPEFRVFSESGTYNATSCLICNAKGYGGGLLFCPDAVMTDGLLDILVLEGQRRLALAKFLIKAWIGIPETGGWIHRFRARTLRMEGDSSVFVQADGELAGTLPLQVSIKNRVFPLVTP